MKSVVIALLFVAVLVGSSSAHEGMIALFSDMTLTDNDADLPIGENYNIEIFYIQGNGSELGLACEFRLVLSTPDAQFLTPVWSDDIVMTMGDVCSGISLAASDCMGGWHGIEYCNIVHIGTVPVRNHSDLDTFTVSLVGHPGIDPPAVQITECSAGNPAHVVQGGTFTFNGVDAEPIAPWLLDAYAEFPLEVRVVFSEEVTAQSAEVPSHYSVFETADPSDPVPVVGAELAQDLQTVTLTLGDFLSGMVDNSVSVSSVEDLEGNQIEPGSEIEIRIIDTTPPAIPTLFLLSTDIVVIEFSECMDRATTEDIANYSGFKYGDPSYELRVSDAHMSSDLMSVELQLDNELTAGERYYIQISNVEDWAGNFIPSPIRLEVTIPLTIIHTPVDDCVVGQDIHVLWDVSDHLYGLESTCLYYRQSGEAAWIELCESNPINPVVMVIEGAEVTGDGLEYYIVATNGIGAIAYHGTPDDPHVIPPCAPWLLDAYAEFPLEVRVVFSEEVTAQSAEVPSHYSVFETADPSDPVPVVGAELAQDLQTVTLTLGDFLSGMVDNSVSVSSVEDLEGNQIEPGSEIEIRIIDTTPPAASAISLSSPDIAVIEFNEWMDRANTEDVANYGVYRADPSEEVQVSEARLSGDLMSVELRLADRLEAGVRYFFDILSARDWAGNFIPSPIRLEVIIPLTIIHTPIDACAVGRDIHVLWDVSDHLYGLESTCLYYRQSGEADWIELCENNPINPVVMVIEGAEVTGDGLEYYIVATNGIGAIAYHGTPDDPHVIPPCPLVVCEQPILLLVRYISLDYIPPLWLVAVEVLNAGPGTANNVSVTMNEDIPWLVIPDPSCNYGDIPEGETGLGIPDFFQFDLSNHPGGSFNVWFSVTYADSCGNEYQLSLDPEFDPGSAGDGEPAMIRTYSLSQNYPNPFNPSTSISYRIPVAGHIEIMIFEATGRLVRTLLDEHRDSGLHTIAWDGRDSKGAALPSGIYFYRLQSGSFSDTKKMILLR